MAWIWSEAEGGKEAGMVGGQEKVRLGRWVGGPAKGQTGRPADR